MEIDDLIEEVTSYKCKFCEFAAVIPSIISEHIRAEHFKPASTSQHTSTDSQTETEAPQSGSEVLLSTSSKSSGETIREEDSTSQQPTVIAGFTEQVIAVHPEGVSADQAASKELYVCGQCSQGFDTIDACKMHMFQDHNITLPPVEQGASISDPVVEDNRVSTGTQCTRKKPGRKSKAEMSEYNPEPIPEPYEDHSYDRVGEDGEPIEGKRRIRMPRALCTDYYVQKQEVKRHHVEKRDLLTEYKLKCEIKGCGARFKSEDALTVHKQCHLKDEKGFKCPHCKIEHESWSNIRSHLWKEHQIDSDLFQCDQCAFRVNSATRLITHKLIHGDERPFICKHCGKGFKQASQARNHELIHIKNKNEELGKDHWSTDKVCHICNRTFANAKTCKKHIQIVHDKIKPFVCPYCTHTSARKAMMQLHMRCHTGEKPFKCDVCNYATGDHNSLRRHKMRHTGQKQYQCPHCAYSCIQAVSLKMHIKGKHFGQEGLYICTECSYRTINKKSFTEHQEDHKNNLIEPKPKSVRINSTSASSSVHRKDAIGAANVVEANVISGQGDISSAQFNLIYSALAAISQNNGSIPQGATITEDENNVQTITIHIPSSSASDVPTNDSYTVAVQEQNVDGIQFESSSEPVVVPLVEENSGVHLSEVGEIEKNDSNENQSAVQEMETDEVVRKNY